MKQLIRKFFIISAIIHLGGAGVVHAQEQSVFSEENAMGQLLYYEVIDSSSLSVEVWGDEFQFDGSHIQYPGHLLIPDTVTHNGQVYTITAIKGNAFRRHREIKSVSIPSTVTRIGDSAFFWCMGISELAIPTNAVSIGHNAFLPIPNIIQPGADAENTYGALAINAYEEDSIFYRDSTKSFLAGARKNIRNTILPEQVDTIGPYAFIQCSSLETVQLQEGLKVIQHDAFGFCSAMQSLVIPSTVISLEKKAFNYCNTRSITINDAPVVIHEHAFDGCKMLSIDFGDNVKAIKSNAFYNCSQLQSAHIPESIEFIGDSVFLSCLALREVTIPSSLTNIPHSMFKACMQLRSITLPATVTNISEYALSECRLLEYIVLMNPVPPTASSTSFAGSNNYATVLVPCGSAEAYSADQNWSYFNYIEEDCDAIDDINPAQIRITSQANHISIHGAAGEPIYIFDAVGRQIYHTPRALDGETVSLPSGVYIVKVGQNKAQKITTTNLCTTQR